MHDDNSTVHCGTQRAWRQMQPCIVKYSIVTRTSTVQRCIVDRELNRALCNTACVTITATVHCGTQRHDEIYNGAWWNTACMTKTQPCIVEHSVHDENSNGALWNTACMMRTQPCIVEHSVMTRTATVHCGTQRHDENSTVHCGALWNIAS